MLWHHQNARRWVTILFLLLLVGWTIYIICFSPAVQRGLLYRFYCYVERASRQIVTAGLWDKSRCAYILNTGTRRHHEAWSHLHTTRGIDRVNLSQNIKAPQSTVDTEVLSGAMDLCMVKMLPVGMVLPRRRQGFGHSVGWQLIVIR